MKLRDIVVDKAIIPQLKSTKREDVITEMVTALIEAGCVDASLQEEFVKAVMSRERKGSTGFGHGVAVPHVKSPKVDKLTVAIGVSSEGIDFKALDKQPVYSLFLLLSPEDRPEEHLDAMEAIFGNLQDDQFRKFLRQAETVADVMTLLDEADTSQVR
ncbi:MAG: PTS sugar transporter subunit IIA [Phycisphaerales bacterium]|nr:PTS sugar transporter subunit IIA [Phycisphaerales bacterium]